MKRLRVRGGLAVAVQFLAAPALIAALAPAGLIDGRASAQQSPPQVVVSDRSDPGDAEASRFQFVVVDQPREDDAPPDPPPQPPVQTLPETTVLGRPNRFPASPLEGDVLVTPTRGESYSSEVASSITVIDEEQIARSRQTSVAEVLRGIVGLDVVQQGGPGRFTSVFMRGANSGHTKVLLDGLPMNDPSNASRSFNFADLTVDNIERIEVLRGPQSVLYGSDAIGGVVNVITKRGQGPLSARVGLEGGSYGTSRESLHLGGGDDCRYYSFSAAYFDNDGISAASRDAGNTEKDSYRNASYSGRFGWNPNELWNIDYVFRYTDADAEVDSFDFFTGLPVDNPLQRNLTRQFFNRLQMQQASCNGVFEQRVGFNFTDYHRRDTDPGFGEPLFEGQSRQVDWQGNVLLTESNVFTVGTDYYQEEASSTSVSRRSQNLASLYLQDQARWGERVFATAGVRWDDHSAAGPATTYRVTALYKHLETCTDFHATLGTGFRAPALAENFFPFGNPDLRPERSKGWDAGVDQSLFCGRLLVGATYFYNSFRDLIVFDFTIPPFGGLANIGRARASGVEATMLWYLNDCTSVSGTYTLTDTLDQDTGQPLLRRPRHKASLGIDRLLACERGHVGVYLLYVGERLDTGSNVLDDYLTVNLAGSYRLSRRCELFARIDNALDEDYEEVRGFGTPGISGFGGVNLTW